MLQIVGLGIVEWRQSCTRISGFYSFYDLWLTLDFCEAGLPYYSDPTLP